MCSFFSVLADDRANIYYHDKEIRALIRSGKSNLREDSHASIAEYHFKDSRKEDDYFKFEYAVLTNTLKYDGIPSMKPSSEFMDIVHGKIKLLDFKEIEPLLNIKPIECPFLDKHIENMTDEIKRLCMDAFLVKDLVIEPTFDSVGASVFASIFDSVWDSVWNLVIEPIFNSVTNLVIQPTFKSAKASALKSSRASARALVWDSVWDSAWDSIRDSVWNSARASVWFYCFTFCDSKSPIDNSSYLKLWEMGIIPVFHDNICYVVTSNSVIGQFSTKEVPDNV